jgi:hypothetical protein
MTRKGLIIVVMLLVASAPALSAPLFQDTAQNAAEADLIKKKQAEAAAVTAKLAEMKAEVEQKLEDARSQRQKLLEANGAVPVKVKAQTVSPLASLQASVKGTFWRDPERVKSLDLSTAQQTKMDEIFQQYRLRLIDKTAALQKEEVILEPLFGATRPLPENESRILTQIDKIAEARAELEKTNSRMLVGILQNLTAEQWNKLPIQARTSVALKKLPR